MITCRSADELVKLRASNQLVARILEALRAMVVAGVTTAEIDAEAERLVREAGAQPAFKGYRGFPATICASRNHEVVHGIPSPSTTLVEGDILSIDMGVKLDGYYGDSAVTVGVGAISAESQRLLDVTEASLYRGIDAVKPGARVSDIGQAVQEYVEAQGFTVVREFVGHGIGTRLHEEPQIPNYGPGGRGPRLAEGMVLAIEPMVNVGKPGVRVLSDGWTAITVDEKLSAHFEHTVAVTADGVEILTLRPAPVSAGR
ncbi:methionine aminopeptidase [Luteitalea sp. TBR-22]|uniref:type I methionyl aminopeptidase n=1 Tax=Luteitalea sp. TBR-22 TaxID=2802971 RepID=UPI001AF3D82B|nr:type I methionyl aminopeptidase [Luteitalea sp. TBR-22]BCS34586.1 methionine aminopeptidase [Luteitalea sp. TBR-22]